MRIKLAAAAIAVSVLLPVRSAHAELGSGAGCGGSLFTMCASWSLSLAGPWSPAAVYTLTVQNVSNTGEGGGISQIGLGNSTPLTVAITPVGSWGNWELDNVQGNPFSGQGLINLVLLTSVDGNQEALQTGQSVTLQFTTSALLDIEQIGFHMISGGLNGQCSTKSVFDIDGGAGQTGTPLGPGSESCQPPIIPEPATVVLLGTGLLGVLGARRFRSKLG
jgi:hypothetical protein